MLDLPQLQPATPEPEKRPDRQAEGGGEEKLPVECEIAEPQSPGQWWQEAQDEEPVFRRRGIRGSDGKGRRDLVGHGSRIISRATAHSHLRPGSMNCF